MLSAALVLSLVIGVAAGMAQTYVTFRGDYRTMLISRSGGAGGPGARADSVDPTISQDGRYIAFASAARNLGPTGGRPQIFVRALRERCHVQCACCDRFSATATRTILVSRANGPKGRPADEESSEPAIAGGGRKIAFTSTAGNLGGRAGVSSVYLRNLFAGTTTLLSRASGPAGAKADGNSVSPAIDDAGDRVVFASDAANLPGAVPGVTQIYERDLRTERTLLVSRASDGSPGNGNSGDPKISADGRAVVFESAATNLGAPPGSGIQIFERRQGSAGVILVSKSAGGTVADAASITPSVDGDGGEVAFASRATNLGPAANPVQNIFVKNVGSGAVILDSRTLGNVHGHLDNGAPANGDSSEPSLDRQGRFVCFSSVATNLGNSYDGFGVDTAVQNVYLHDMRNHGTFLISRVSGRYGHGGNGDSGHVDCTAGASLAAFQTTATNLGGGARPGVSNIYRRTIFGGK